MVILGILILLIYLIFATLTIIDSYLYIKEGHDYES